MRHLLALLICLLPVVSHSQEADPKVRLKTNHGDIIVELNATQAPISTENFLNYTKKGHYNGTTFHRVISNFMIQGGGFALEDGTLIQKATDSPIQNEGQNGLKNVRGSLAMARTNNLHSATSQFFINVVDNPNLNYPNLGGYAVFGKVVEGMEVVDKIRALPTGVKPLGNRLPNGEVLTRPTRDVPLDPVIIESAEVLEHKEENPAPTNSGSSSNSSLGEESHVDGFMVSPWKQPLSYVPMLLAFLLGSIPFGLLIAKSQGVDIREHGSGNIGATNVWRILGKKFGIPCLLLDMLKGLIPVLLVTNLLQIDGRAVQLALPLPEAWIAHASPNDAIHIQINHILTALLAVLGHNFSPWVRFKGGKGIATSAGVLIGLMPAGVLFLITLWLLLLFITRYVSVASVMASLSLPVMVIYGSWHHGRLQDGTWNKPLFTFALVIALMSTWKHRSNIKRLIQGTETKFIE